MIVSFILRQSIDGAKRESQTLVIMAKKPKHEFGGPWTEVKLDAISEYLDFYQNALKNRGFETWYVDAFAGTGERNAKVTKGGIFENAPLEEVEEVLAGSAKRALQITPSFTHYWFSEQRPTRVKALEALREEFDSDIIVRRGDAGEQLRGLFSSPPWANHRYHWKQRAVVFLDPYGMSVGFDTLKMLAETKRTDVWYLFPRKAVIQQLANKNSGIDDGKRASLTRILPKGRCLANLQPKIVSAWRIAMRLPRSHGRGSAASSPTCPTRSRF